MLRLLMAKANAGTPTELKNMVAFLFTEGIQLTAAHSGGRCPDLTQEEVQHLWRYNLYSQGKYFNQHAQELNSLKYFPWE